jgi:hypothetical protein
MDVGPREGEKPPNLGSLDIVVICFTATLDALFIPMEIHGRRIEDFSTAASL